MQPHSKDYSIMLIYSTYHFKVVATFEIMLRRFEIKVILLTTILNS